MLSARKSKQAMDEGVAQVTPTKDTDLALEAIAVVAMASGEITSDDVWRVLEALGSESLDHPNAMGAAFRRAATDGIIRPTDRVRRSTRVSAHCRKVSVWKTTQEGRAK